MKIELARYSGFCMGVRDAILRIVGELNASDEEIFVYGPLIHNPQTVDILGRRGLTTISDLSEIDDKVIAIRTHGIPIEKLREIKTRARRYLNLTCPRVSRVQGLIKNYSNNGYFTIIIGDEEHAEVLGLKSYASSGVIVVPDVSGIGRIPGAEKYIVVSQTTQDREQFNEIVGLLKSRLPNIKVFNTICESTHNRQSDIRDGISRKIDALVVVGGRHSANTMRLAQMSRECNVKTFHIETEAELRAEDFRGIEHVLVTAGASTPGWIINNVMERLYEIKFRNSSILVSLFVKLTEFLIRSNLLSASAAAFITLFTQSFSGFHPDAFQAVISFLYIFAMYTLNNFFELKFLLVRNPVKYAAFNKSKHVIVPLALLSLAGIFALTSRYEAPVFITYAILCLLGALYSTDIVKKLVYRFRWAPVKRFYDLKNLVSAFGWLISTTLIPLYTNHAGPLYYIAIGSFVFSLIILRNILVDVIAFQGDLIFGRQTLPTMLGIKKTKTLTFIIAVAAAALFSTFTLAEGEFIYLIFLLNLLYFAGVLWKVVSKNYFVALKYEVFVDFNLVLFIGFYFISQAL